MANSIADGEMFWFTLNGGAGTTKEEKKFDYFADLSGLVPREKFSLADHQKTVFKTVSGSPFNDFTRLEIAWMQFLNGAANTGSVGDRRKVFYA